MEVSPDEDELDELDESDDEEGEKYIEVSSPINYTVRLLPPLMCIIPFAELDCTNIHCICDKTLCKLH